MRRLIIFAPSCDLAAAKLGGYVRIDAALSTVMQALLVNPYAFRAIETDFTRCRWLRTVAVNDVPPLVWTFEIDVENNVVISHVEEADS